MPELPEVETIVRDLRPVLVGQSFVDLQSTVPSAVVTEFGLLDDLVGKKVLRIERRGKFFSIFFESDLVMTMHLRMSGRILVRDHEEEPLRFERTRIDFSESSLRFCDMRKFGKVWVNSLEDYEDATGIWKLGIEPFSAEFDFAEFLERFEGRRGIVKKWLLDQRLIAGIGNIYADEACFYAGVRPDAELGELSKEKLEKLFKSVVRALEQGVRNRGTSVSDYEDAFGRSGKNQEVLFVYGRGGKPCLECGEVLIKTRVAGRGTVYCERCQPARAA